MTVAELIKALSAFPCDWTVEKIGDENDTGVVVTPDADTREVWL